MYMGQDHATVTFDFDNFVNLIDLDNENGLGFKEA